MTHRRATDHSHVGTWVQRHSQPQGHWLLRSGPEPKPDDLQTSVTLPKNLRAVGDARCTVGMMLSLTHLLGMPDLGQGHHVLITEHWAQPPLQLLPLTRVAPGPRSCLWEWSLAAWGFTGRKGKISIWLELAMPWLLSHDDNWVWMHVPPRLAHVWVSKRARGCASKPISETVRTHDEWMYGWEGEKDTCRFRGQIKSWQRHPFLQDLQGWPNARGVNLCCGYRPYSSSLANCYSYRPWQLILLSAASSGSKLTIVDSSVGPGRRNKKRGSLESLYFSWFLLGVWVQSRHLEELPDLVLEVSGAVPCLCAWTSCPPSLNIKTEAFKLPTIKRSPTFWVIWPSWDHPQQLG